MEAGTKRNFILQQGLQEPSPDISPAQYSALQFQPRVVGVVILVGVVLQSAAVFLALSALLWWSALLHRWNPFDAVYNSTLGARPGAVSLKPAPAPPQVCCRHGGHVCTGDRGIASGRLEGCRVRR